MTSADPSRSDTSSPSAGSSQRFSAVRLPIEGPVQDVSDAVAKLKKCESTELRRARKHHQRALASLKNGGYTNLPDDTRTRLTDQLQTNLDALNRALDTSGASETSPEEPSTAPSISARIRAFFRGLW